MNLLVIDTIHGGDVLGKALTKKGHHVDVMDVYRHKSGVDVQTALARTYDLVIAPVHLDPDHPLLRSQQSAVISHHDAVRRLLGDQVPRLMVEITGARGKTTTAYALAHTMNGAGVLHASSGTYLYPDRQMLWKKSITPASLLAAADKAGEIGGWLVAEESLGVTGAGLLAIITSAGDYSCAAGKKSALAVKLQSAMNSRTVLLAPPLEPVSPGMIPLDSIARCKGTVCDIEVKGTCRSFQSTLLKLDAYRLPLMLAGAAACILGIDPSPLSTFQPVEGRLSVRQCGNVTIVDNANSGTDLETTVEAARYARSIARSPHLTLVIGMEPADGAVCEGFPDPQILEAIRAVSPQQVILVGNSLCKEELTRGLCTGRIRRSPSFALARDAAQRTTENGSIVLAVKTWR